MYRNYVRRYPDMGGSLCFAPLDGKKLAKKIEKRYEELGVKIRKIKLVSRKNEAVFIFRIKLKKKTKTQEFIGLSSRVRDSFKRSFTLFRAQKNAQGLFLLVSETVVPSVDLFRILRSVEFQDASQRFDIPIVIGEDLHGKIHIEDLVELKHILVGGTTGSGKSVFLRSLVTTLIASRSPDWISIVLFDTGSNDLAIFDGACQLACHIIQDQRTATQAIFDLQAEMEHRLKNPGDDPYLICVADEATELLSNFEDEKTKDKVCEAVSDMLRRGRKANIIWVLATQTATRENFPLELTNLPTRIAFKCTSYTQSSVILGKKGAETLEGNGDMYLKCPNSSSFTRIQGAFPNPKVLSEIVAELVRMDCNYPNKFRITPLNPAHYEMEVGKENLSNQGREKTPEWNKKLCEIMLWAIGKDRVSAYSMMKNFHLGDGNASDFMAKLEEFGIVSGLIAKKSREVLCHNPEDLSEKTLDFLTENRISMEEIEGAFHKEENDEKQN